MPAISYQNAASGDLLVKVPYEVKDLFKKSFRGMKWMPDEKVWKLPASREKRLKSWIETVNNEAAELEEQLEARDQVELTAKDVDGLQNDLQQLQRELCDLQEHREKLEELTVKRHEILAKLEKLKPQVELAKAEKGAAQAEADAEAERLEAIVRDVCSLGAVSEAQDTMAKIANKRGAMLSREKSEYRQAQSVIEEQHDRLKSVGWGSRGLDRLEFMNPNRPDRDNPNDISMDDILDLVELEPDAAPETPTATP